jgi:hypothetical protein
MRITLGIVVLALVLVGGMGIYAGHFPPPGHLIKQLANRPEISARFSDGPTGRFDASMFLFTSLLVAPILFLLGVLLCGLAMVVLESTVMPIGRQLGVPDAMMVTLVLAVLASAAYAKSEVWLPHSLNLLGLLARAYLVSVSAT